MKITKALLWQIFAFGCVGVLASAVHYFVALGLTNYEVLVVYWANLAGYLVAVCVSLFGHSIFTYKKSITKKIVSRFVVVSLSTFGLSQCLLVVMEEWLKWPPTISLAVIVCSIPALSFLLNKFWVYEDSVS